MKSSPDETVSALRAARKTWRNRGNKNPDFRLGIIGTVTLDALVPYLGTSLMERGWHPEIHLAPYNQIFQSLISPPTAFSGPVPDNIVVLPRLDELVGEELSSFCAGDFGAWESAQEKLRDILTAIEGCRKIIRGLLLAGDFPFPTVAEAEILAVDGLAMQFFDRANRFWNEAIAKIPGVQSLDVSGLQANLGVRNTIDMRRWYLYRQPFNDDFLFEMGTLLSRLISASKAASKKCAVVDCDNTLWGGVIGEDGLEGIRLGDEFPGSAYRDFQKLLKHWRQQGVFLAICSKNNLADVQEVFRKHQGMYLKEDDVSAWSVDWKPKSEQLVEIAAHMNIGVDALVLFDDSSFELAEVKARHPGVDCVQIPARPEMIVQIARHAFLFDKLEITEDDRTRAERYAVEEKRDAVRQALSINEFIRKLELKVDTVAPRTDNIARITQLINKTNQFNLTTPRFTQSDIMNMASSNSHILRAATVCDKFGEYGLTCVGILERDGGAWNMSAFLMSCRILGRGVETSFLADLAAEVIARGGEEITARFIPTRKNSISEDFLPRHGFVETNGVWRNRASILAGNRPAGRSALSDRETLA